ncbi:hypothetical protein HPB48_021352 [Haemaphysalis longicornis]|uniref:Uncharacterized protein n=1 Tax=Haemaphysalis longicornis TaxID=44386 RepID=A0A9J6GZF4_HAELO|nr:hypothetical protein HPB48_021352 [Haemaphysalis longicornis]
MAMRNSNESQTNPAVPPQGLFRLRHLAFVACLGLASAAVLIGAPVAVWKTMVHCEGASCLSVEDDLRSSQDPTVKPCDDFYRHVCGRWPEVERVYMTPTIKYDAVHDLAFLREAIFLAGQNRNRPLGVQNVMGDLMVTCHQQQPDESQLQWFLSQLRLPWPARSATNELELLDMIAGASLKYNLPIMWIFAVGRHLRRPRENALYLMLDGAVEIWMRQMTVLVKRRNLALFLRRCAERVGGTGQSYDSMIRNVLTTHRELELSLRHSFDIVQRPEYINFSDVTLRQAVNRHLPDESQQWPEDSVICLQRLMFRRFRARHLVDAQMASAFKNYAGAYVVWYLAPYVSPYLTASLMEDLGHPQRLRDFVRARCSALILGVLPMPFFKAKTEGKLGDAAAIFATFATLRSVIETTMARHDRAAGQRLSAHADTLAMNFYNMSVPWLVLDRMYAGIPHVHDSNFFNMYQTVATYSLRQLKQSMRKPNNSYVHVPHLTTVGIYRAVAAREIRIPLVNVLWPKFHPRYPLAARMAGLGVEAARNLVGLFNYAFFFHEDFRSGHRNSTDFPPSIYRALAELHLQLDAAVSRIGNASLPEEELKAAAMEAIAVVLAHAASKALPEAHAVPLAVRAVEASKRPNFFASLAPDELFFRLACFYHCSISPGLQERVLCNYAVPRLRGFASAFGCKAGDAMFVPPAKNTFS